MTQLGYIKVFCLQSKANELAKVEKAGHRGPAWHCRVSSTRTSVNFPPRGPLAHWDIYAARYIGSGGCGRNHLTWNRLAKSLEIHWNSNYNDRAATPRSSNF
jgi:hypothetical protein